MDLLKGIRVLDVTAWLFVPSAGAVLSQWGAEVIKVEPTRAPDPMRHAAAPGRTASLFDHYNRGKRGIAIDLTHEEGRDLLYQLVRRADVFLTSYLTETRQKLKIDVSDIKAHNGNVIYAKGTGRGPRGPFAERGGYDLATFWARGSLAETAARAAGSSPPYMIGHGDGMSGHTLAGGICAALLQRERGGHPAVVDGSLLATAVWFNGPAINAAAYGMPAEPSLESMARSERNPLMNSYRTSDGRFIQLCMVTDPDADWADLVSRLDRPDLAADPRFKTEEMRQIHSSETVAVLDELLARHTYQDLLVLLADACGVWEPVQTPAEIHHDPQAIANGYVRNASSDSGDLPLVSPAVMFDGDTGAPKRGPKWGEHTDEILGELGIPEYGIAQLRDRGIIR
jgi:crotonobetainyl-CoA:carnitine CoA-transferase CaiB-like acyl-CoA transferase